MLKCGFSLIRKVPDKDKIEALVLIKEYEGQKKTHILACFTHDAKLKVSMKIQRIKLQFANQNCSDRGACDILP